MNDLAKPRLFLVGVPKAGTSALSAQLSQHPEICLCGIKEPNFFAPDLNMPGPKTEEEYLSLFVTTPQTRVLLDASILYLYSRVAAKQIANYVEDPKLLIVLRNPVDAMHAWHGQMVYTSNEPLVNFEEALAAEAERKQGRKIPTAGSASRCPALLFYRDMFRYAEQLERYFDVFDRNQIHIINYDDFRRDPTTVHTDIMKFAGLDPSFMPKFDVVNPSKERKFQNFHFLLKRLFAAPTRALLPARVRLNFIEIVDRFTSRPVKRKSLDPALRTMLAEECRADILRLNEMLGGEFTSWLEHPVDMPSSTTLPSSALHKTP